VVIVGHAKIRNRCGGVEGGSKLKLDRTGFSANETVGLLFKIVLTLFWRRSMVAERSSFAKSWGGGRENMQLRSIALSTTGYLRSSSPYHPRGAPIFPICRTENTTRTEVAQSVKACRNKYARHRNIRRETVPTEQKETNPLLPCVFPCHLCQSCYFYFILRVQTHRSPVQACLNWYRRHRSSESRRLH